MKGIAAECNRRRPASCRDTDPLPILSVSLLRIRIFGPETRRGTDKAAHLSVSQLGNRNFGPELRRGTDATREWSVSWQRKNSESRTRNTPFPSTRVAREGDYHTGRRLLHGKAIVRFIWFVLLSICFKRQRWSIPPNWRTATPRWRKRRSHGCAP